MVSTPIRDRRRTLRYRKLVVRQMVQKKNRDGIRRGMGDITYAQVRGHLSARLASGEFQTIERSNMPGRQFTTAKTIAAKLEIVSRVREGRNQMQAVISRSQAISIVDGYQHLNRTQRSVVEDVLSSPNRIQGLQGFAGSGKTTTLSVTAMLRGFKGVKSRDLLRLPVLRARSATLASRRERSKDSLCGRPFLPVLSRNTFTLLMNQV